MNVSVFRHFFLTCLNNYVPYKQDVNAKKTADCFLNEGNGNREIKKILQHMHRKFYCLFLVLSSRNMERVNFGGKKNKREP